MRRPARITLSAEEGEAILTHRRHRARRLARGKVEAIGHRLARTPLATVTQALSAHGGESIDAFAKIHQCGSHKDTTLWSELQH